jgi:hypothetical protein
MSSGKQPNELSKLLKDNEKPKIINLEILYKQYEKPNLTNYIINKIYENLLLITLIVILFFLITLYFLLVSLKSQKDSKNNDNYNYYNRFRNKYNYDFDDYEYGYNTKKFKKSNFTNLFNETKICEENHKFVILSRTNCQECGLFSYYIVHLGCIITFLDEGYIPLIETSSFPNVFNGYKESSTLEEDPWETFFNQPCGYTLEEVKKKPNVAYLECECSDNMPSEKELYSNKTLIEYYHKISQKYMSVKQNIMDEANSIWEKLFHNSSNVLGILVRGTDYITIQPPGHSIPPSAEIVIKDAKKKDRDNKYDYIFLATEDNNIRKKFIKQFGSKINYLLPDRKIEYNYEEGDYLTSNKDVNGNMEFEKIYLLSMIILSKCIDIISARTSGAAGAFILSEGFRNDLVYYIGEYY